MWNFLTNLVNQAIGLIMLPITLVIFLISLPVVAITACVGICLGDKNKSSFSPAELDKMNLKLAEVAATYGKDIKVDPAKATSLATLMQKLSDASLSKSEKKAIQKELGQEVKEIKKDVKSQLGDTEYKAMKKAVLKSLVSASVFKNKIHSRKSVDDAAPAALALRA